MKLRCLFGHDWERRTRFIGFIPNLGARWHLIQHRVCARCGKHETSEQLL